MIFRILKIFSIVLMFSLGRMQLTAQSPECVYLQTDKQLYVAGELLWLKMYTTDVDGKLQSLSKIGYVELVRDSIPEVQIKLDVVDGTGAGWMELPAMLPTGYYRMIAYTRYMRNEGENAFFEKIIAVVNPFNQTNELYAGDINTPFSLAVAEKNNTTLEMSSDKSVYSKRNKGEFKIKGLPAENISLGISITGSEPSLITNRTIDDWKKQLPENHSNVVNPVYLPEYEGAIIDGVLIDLETGNPADDPQAFSLLSFPGKDVQLFAGQAGENGNLIFYTQCVTGKHELTTTAVSSTGKRYRTDVLPPYALHTPIELPLFAPDSAWLDYLQKRNLAVQVTHAYMADSLSVIKELSPCSYYRPYSRYELDEYTRFPNMEEVFIEFIMFGRIRRTNEGRRFSIANEWFTGYNTNILVLFDNIPVVNHELMSAYNPLLIKTIDLHIGRYVFGGRLFEGMISFFSYKNDFPGVTFGENTQIFDYEGAQPYRYFYSPAYDATNASSRLPDFRHTLLWEPDIQSNGQNEISVPFTTSDIPGSYIITVEGIGENGTIVRAKHVIEVK